MAPTSPQPPGAKRDGDSPSLLLVFLGDELSAPVNRGYTDAGFRHLGSIAKEALRPPFFLPLIPLGFRDYRPVEVSGEIRAMDENRQCLPTAPVTFHGKRHLHLFIFPAWMEIRP